MQGDKKETDMEPSKNEKIIARIAAVSSTFSCVSGIVINYPHIKEYFNSIGVVDSAMNASASLGTAATLSILAITLVPYISYKTVLFFNQLKKEYNMVNKSNKNDTDQPQKADAYNHKAVKGAPTKGR